VLTTNADSPLARVVDGEAPYGLADVLRRDVGTLNALVAVPSVPQLRVLLPGGPDPDVELPVGGLLEAIAELAARFDHVLIETGPPAVAAEAQALAGHVDGVLLVAEARRTHNHEITTAVHQFEQVEAEVLGVVLMPAMRPDDRVSRRGRRGAGRDSGPAPAGGEGGGEGVRPAVVVAERSTGRATETAGVPAAEIAPAGDGSAGEPAPARRARPKSSDSSDSTAVPPRITDTARKGEARRRVQLTTRRENEDRSE
jgi:hypothetical protein